MFTGSRVRADQAAPSLVCWWTITLSSILAADATGSGFYLTPGETGFEDGTINYLMLPAAEIGLRYLEAIGIETIHERVRCLTGWLSE